MDKMNPLRLLVILIGLIGVAVLTVSVIGWLTQPIRTADGVRERLGDPDNVLKADSLPERITDKTPDCG